MKVLIATPYFWPQVGGMENYARFLARGLAEVGCEVALIESFDGGLGADGHEDWRLDAAVGGVEEAGASACSGALGDDLEGHLGHGAELNVGRVKWNGFC